MAEDFKSTKENVLKRLGYEEGKKGSQDNSKDIEKWMLSNGGKGVSKTVRGFWINDVMRTRSIDQLNKFLRDNRLILKNDHLERGK